jgi:hypothetical protein
MGNNHMSSDTQKGGNATLTRGCKGKRLASSRAHSVHRTRSREGLRTIQREAIPEEKKEADRARRARSG